MIRNAWFTLVLGCDGDATVGHLKVSKPGLKGPCRREHIHGHLAPISWWNSIVDLPGEVLWSLHHLGFAKVMDHLGKSSIHLVVRMTSSEVRKANGLEHSG